VVFVSDLALGLRGCIQVVNLIVIGVRFSLFTLGATPSFKREWRRAFAPYFSRSSESVFSLLAHS
jgi:hypothetical protein